MAKAASKNPLESRETVVRRLSAIFGWSAALQAGVFLAADWAARFAIQSLLDLLARSGETYPPPLLLGAVAAAIMLFDLFLALAVGFFGARRLLRAIVRATPQSVKPPTRPVPLAALLAGAVVAIISVFVSATKGEQLYGWLIELARDGGIIALMWYAARRAAAPKPA